MSASNGSAEIDQRLVCYACVCSALEENGEDLVHTIGPGDAGLFTTAVVASADLCSECDLATQMRYRRRMRIPGHSRPLDGTGIRDGRKGGCRAAATVGLRVRALVAKSEPLHDCQAVLKRQAAAHSVPLPAPLQLAPPTVAEQGSDPASCRER